MWKFGKLDYGKLDWFVNSNNDIHNFFSALKKINNLKISENKLSGLSLLTIESDIRERNIV